MTSRRHYVRKHNAIMHGPLKRLVRGWNVPDEYLTTEQMEVRQLLQSIRARIDAKDTSREKRTNGSEK